MKSEKIKMVCLEFFFICLVITASYENSIMWDEERLEEATALLEVVGEKKLEEIINFLRNVLWAQFKPENRLLSEVQWVLGHLLCKCGDCVTIS